MTDTVGLRDKIERSILPDHRVIGRDGMGGGRCACGSEWHWWTDYYSHVTDVLLDAMQGALADAWDEGHADGQHNEHEYRPGRQITNPWREDS